MFWTSRAFGIQKSDKIVYAVGSDGKKREVVLAVKQMAFWSRDYFKRARHERAKVIEKSKSVLIRADISSAKAKTSLRYVKESPYDKKTGEKKGYNYTLDEEKITRDEAMDGYYCIITSETHLKDREIIDIYHGLWRIEDSFRVTKSTLDARPVYVSREDHIRAHFMVCYCALLILRLIQADLNWKYSAQSIADDLYSLMGINEDANLYIFNHRTDLSDELGKIANLDFPVSATRKNRFKTCLHKRGEKSDSKRYSPTQNIVTKTAVSPARMRSSSFFAAKVRS